MFFMQLRSGQIIMDHLPTRTAALHRAVNYDFIYAEWCGCEITRKDLIG